MNLTELPEQTQDYNTLKEVEVIKLIIWWAHKFDAKVNVSGDELRAYYRELGRAIPDGGFTSYLNSQVDRRPPHLLKSRGGYRLEHRILKELDSKYAQRDATIHVHKLLTDLPDKLVNIEEQAYLQETLLCFRAKAFKASVVMAWNLTYDHVCRWILADPQRLASFNAQMARTCAKKNYPPILNRDSFEEPKESEVIQVLASAGLINGAAHTVLKEKLDRRNKAAHPSGMVVTQLTAEGVISDLIENVVIKLH